MSEFAAVVKAPDYPPQLKHKVIFETFDGLDAGQAMLLINDHDPKPLYFQFQATRSELFTWDYVEQGPELFQVKIGKKS
ncbi:hypothetical protein DNH61_13695 [Paenibacillus sambharensis]|uniref:DUF2249 domain-containing protein n=1 Tax=Paenibacillus sambharensis TaxID=1803190 RepID=A0A2W1L8J4_9BACL|nr:DUF2249 domain-containing protein [Paenibacillus sambharensis]PZD95576.1 hypothetical protein DNH61_13695 [Paenibacillus sambharensis]